MATHSMFLPGESQGRRSLVGCVSGVAQSQTRLKQLSSSSSSSKQITILELMTPLCTWTSLVAQLVKNPPAMWETWVRSLGWEDPLEKGKATHSNILGLPWWLSW